MSKQEKEGLLDCLFSRQDMKLTNIKFFRGSRDLISEDEFRGQVHESLKRREKQNALSHEPPKTKKAPIDVRSIVADT